MGILGEFLIIAATALTGILLAAVPGFPFPGAVTGMIIMLIMLMTRIIKLDRIKNASGFFIKFLPLFFIPFIVNLLKEQELLREYGFKFLLIIVGTTIITLAATGLTAMLLMKIIHEKDGRDD